MILVIEDDKSTCEVLKLVIENEFNAKVLCVYNVTDAKKSLREFPITLVLGDLVLKGDGDLTKLVDDIKCPLIVLTASNRKKEELDKLRPFAILKKPFDLDELFSLIKEVRK